ncbi:4-hydroxybenzoate polyprenyltransferase [Methanofollis sp. W23]|uniref:prenyltransferase n=1 Tax=Methanofollis sp. W23 TaxID=2817849 RepID=UPI001D21E43E|nr:4-hydroxybenzoate polyprenyltransferase [Methanofollis sp. W23]
MTALLALAYSVSRPRFWIYTGGTYVLGYALGMASWTAFFLPTYALYLLYFFFPANVFIYGVNDRWDRETDRLNQKKREKEHYLVDAERQDLRTVLLLVAGFSLLLLVSQTPEEKLVFLLFLFLSYFYSAPPLRFKEVPVLDFSSNMLYIMPGVFGYLLASGTFPPLLLVAAGFLHIAAMHLFSAVPDIECDRAAGITTTAVLVGERASLLLCLLFWSGFALLVIGLAGFSPLALPVLLFPAVPLLLLLSRRMRIGRVYWYLPLVNTALGGLAFTAVTLSKAI